MSWWCLSEILRYVDCSVFRADPNCNSILEQHRKCRFCKQGLCQLFSNIDIQSYLRQQCWNFTPDSSISLEIRLMSGFGKKNNVFKYLASLLWFLWFSGHPQFQQFQRWWLHKPGLEHDNYRKINSTEWRRFMHAFFQNVHYKIPCFAALLCSRNGHGILHGTVDAMGYWPGGEVVLPKAHHGMCACVAKPAHKNRPCMMQWCASKLMLGR